MTTDASPSTLPPFVSRPRPPGRIRRAARFLSSHHLFGSLFIVAFASAVISDQVSHRTDFADSELVKEVESVWGAPVSQPAPSLRAVQSGSIFTELRPVAFDQQHVQVDARMNYRKRGLRYFSGFDFTFSGHYTAVNRFDHDADVAFIFPLTANKSQVLLSELMFKVNGADASLDLGEEGNRLMWTGRIPQGATAEFFIRYRARGLESFLYRLDPSLPAHDVKLHVGVQGGENYDYPAGALAAQKITQASGAVALDWEFPSLESGVNLGVILPSEMTYDTVIATMAQRSWVPFLALIAGLAALGIRHRRPLAFYEAYLVAASYGFFFVLLAYLAAFMNFYLAYGISLLGIGAAVTAFLRRIFPTERRWVLASTWGVTMLVPTGAVVLQGYTGLIYTLEILAVLLGLMVAATHKGVRAFLSDLPGQMTQGAQ
jgi:hypothetical protein